MRYAIVSLEHASPDRIRLLVPAHYSVQRISDLAVLLSGDATLTETLQGLVYRGIHAVEIDPRTAAILLRSANP